jgi:hypothetical protein
MRCGTDGCPTTPGAAPQEMDAKRQIVRAACFMSYRRCIRRADGGLWPRAFVLQRDGNSYRATVPASRIRAPGPDARSDGVTDRATRGHSLRSSASLGAQRLLARSSIRTRPPSHVFAMRQRSRDTTPRRWRTQLHGTQRPPLRRSESRAESLGETRFVPEA